MLATGLLLAWGVLLGVGVPVTQAQRTSASVTAGLQVGRPGGLTVKLYRRDAVSYDALFTTDGDEYVRLAVHRLQERPLPDSLVYLYYGAGGAVGGRRLDETPTLRASIGAKFGINFFADRLEVFLHAAPRLRLTPSVTPRLGGGVGLRYHFRRP